MILTNCVKDYYWCCVCNLADEQYNLEKLNSQIVDSHIVDNHITSQIYCACGLINKFYKLYKDCLKIRKSLAEMNLFPIPKAANNLTPMCFDDNTNLKNKSTLQPKFTSIDTFDKLKALLILNGDANSLVALLPKDVVLFVIGCKLFEVI